MILFILIISACFTTIVCSTPNQILREEIPEAVERLSSFIDHQELTNTELFYLIQFFSHRERIVNDTILWANNPKITDKDITTAREGLARIDNEIKKFHLFSHQLPDNLRYIISVVNATGYETFFFEATPSFESIELFIKDPSHNNTEIIRKFSIQYILAFTTIIYEPENRVACPFFRSMFLIRLYDTLIKKFLDREPPQELVNQLRLFLLPAYQITWLHYEHQSDYKSRLFELLYFIRLHNLVRIVETCIEQKERLSHTNKNIARRLECYDHIIAPLKNISQEVISRKAHFHGSAGIRDAVYAMLYQDLPGSHGLLDFHLSRVASQLDIELNHEIVDCSAETLQRNIQTNHKWVCDFCSFIVGEFERFNYFEDHHAQPVVTQKKTKQSTGKPTRSLPTPPPSTSPSQVSQSPGQIHRQDQPDNELINIFKHHDGTIFTHFPDDLVIPKGSVILNKFGLISRTKNAALIFDNKRFDFGGHPVLIAIFNANECSQDQRADRLLSTMNYDYLRQEHKKITNLKDNNHAFSEIIEKGFGYWGKIISDEAITESPKKIATQYGAAYSRRAQLIIPMSILDSSTQKTSDQIIADGPRGVGEFTIYYSTNHQQPPLCVHRFYRETRSNAARA